MPLTRFPNGLTVCTTSALVYNTGATDSNGSIDCLNLFVNGTTSTGVMSVNTLTATSATVTNLLISSAGRLTLSSSTAVTSSTFIGERAYLPFTFTSAASTAGLIALPFASQVIDCWVTCDTTPRVCSAFTLYSGNSASGTVCVASVALTFSTAIGQQVQPTLTAAAAITATALAYVVTTAGSAGNFYGVVTIQRTA